MWSTSAIMPLTFMLKDGSWWGRVFTLQMILAEIIWITEKGAVVVGTYVGYLISLCVSLCFRLNNHGNVSLVFSGGKETSVKDGSKILRYVFNSSKKWLQTKQTFFYDLFVTSSSMGGGVTCVTVASVSLTSCGLLPASLEKVWRSLKSPSDLTVLE